MAIVGSRPERPVFVDQFSQDVAGYRWRHRLPVSLTGLAQVEDSRGDRPIAERVGFDNHYIEHWSLWRDVRLLLQTVMVLVRDALKVRRRR
ncbi:MAG: sugar transferase [Actinobacteria bacterium]|nr:sugar transferase [Actinomycetota bacterium]